jgi:dihydroorotate dehydrogenase electron transfer subunit
LREGDRIGVRGPYGKCFIRKGRRVALIAGGIGAAPLAFLAEKSIKPTTFLGAKSREQLLFSRRFKKAGKLFLATEDGSSGYHGMVTDLLGSNLKKFDQIYVCGPEQMILKVLKICRNLRIEKRVQALVERYIKCAYGICGSCDLGGYKVCTDGPVFRGDLLVRTELGRFRRESSGRLLSLEKL